MASSRVAALLMGITLMGAGHAFAGGVVVPMDNVMLVSFKRPVATIYVGNPNVADVTMMDSRHAFVLGKNFGETNLIALDSDKTIVSNEPITVAHRVVGSVTVFRGSDTNNYTCTQMHCETNPIPGDAATYFGNAVGEAAAHGDAAAKAAGGGPVSSVH